MPRRKEFLQALFISRRTYPIAYDKWIQEQLEVILELPGLYRQLVQLYEIQAFEGHELTEKAQALEAMFETYIVSE